MPHHAPWGAVYRRRMVASVRSPHAPSIVPFNGVKVFSATMIAMRERLGETVTEWIDVHPTYTINDIVVTQSSDSGFHCIAITVFYTDPTAAR